jgi:hypothetical protein
MSLNVGARIKRYSVMLCIGLVFFSSSSAVADVPAAASTPPRASLHETRTTGNSLRSAFKQLFDTWESEFTITTGTRSDDLDWSIAGNAAGTNPDVLSELDWSDVESYQVTLADRSIFAKHIYLRGAFSYAGIQDGTVRDSDYGNNSRTAEWSRSICQTNGDELWDVSAGGGYAFYLLDGRLLVAPLLGVSYHKQNLRITNGMQVISQDNPFSSSLQDNPPPVGPLTSELNSTYFARWMGPWIGCDLRYQTQKRTPDALVMSFGLSLEMHLADYYGEGNWNLRGDLAHPKSFEHDADGIGLCVSAEWRVVMAEHWDITFTASHQDWSTGGGTDRKFHPDGGASITRLNGVNWQSSSFMVGAGYRF